MKNNTGNLGGGRKFIPFFSIFFLLLASLISLSRINNFYHYPIDVFCGALIGVCVGVYFNKKNDEMVTINEVEEKDYIETVEMSKYEDNGV